MDDGNIGDDQQGERPHKLLMCTSYREDFKGIGLVLQHTENP